MKRMSTIAALAVAVLIAAPAGASAACQRWNEKTLATAVGWIENLDFDGQGGLILSLSRDGALKRMTPDGAVETLLTGIKSPGGVKVRGDDVYFNTQGDSYQALLGNPNGTIDVFNLSTRARRTWATGMPLPNGLEFLPDGSAVTSRDINGGQTGITRVDPADPAHPIYNWAQLDDSNGLILDPTGTWLYTVETFTPDARVYRILVADPRVVEVVASLSDITTIPPKGLDDLTIDDRGVLYITANGSGEVIRLDPSTNDACVIAGGVAAGWRNTSAAEFGAGEGWNPKHLYVVSWDGTVRELSPPGKKRVRARLVTR